MIPRDRKNLATIVRELGVKLRVVHDRLVLALQVRRVFIFVNNITQMKKKRGPDRGRVSALCMRIGNLPGHGFCDR